MNQHQAGCAGVPVKSLKQTALKWKVKGKATSHGNWQEVMRGSQSVRKSGGGRYCPPQSFDWGTAVLTHSKVQASEGQSQSALELGPSHCPNGRLGQDLGFGGFASCPNC